MASEPGHAPVVFPIPPRRGHVRVILRREVLDAGHAAERGTQVACRPIAVLELLELLRLIALTLGIGHEPSEMAFVSSSPAMRRRC